MLLEHSNTKKLHSVSASNRRRSAGNNKKSLIKFNSNRKTGVVNGGVFFYFFKFSENSGTCTTKKIAVRPACSAGKPKFLQRRPISRSDLYPPVTDLEFHPKAPSWQYSHLHCTPGYAFVLSRLCFRPSDDTIL